MYHNMSKIILTKGIFSRPVVAADCAPWLYDSLNKYRQAGAGRVLQVLQTNTVEIKAREDMSAMWLLVSLEETCKLLVLFY